MVQAFKLSICSRFILLIDFVETADFWSQFVGFTEENSPSLISGPIRLYWWNDYLVESSLVVKYNDKFDHN